MSEKLPLISVIVPVYNVERYLHECVDSILAQTYISLEIILIDDGSSDSSGEICDDYAKKDNRVIVIHKENGGLSSARNAGIDVVGGEYVTFIDSDDYIEKDMIFVLYNNLIKYDANISVCSYYASYVTSNEALIDTNEILVLNKEQAIEQCLKGEALTVSACFKLYEKYIFDKIRYPVGKYCEDAFVIVDVLSRAEKVVVETTPKYYYRQRKGSIMHNFKRAEDEIEARKHIFEKLEADYPNLHKAGKIQLLRATYRIFTEIINSKNYRDIPQYREIFSTIRKNHKFIAENIGLNLKGKVVFWTLRVNVRLYKLLITMVSYRNREKVAEVSLFE